MTSNDRVRLERVIDQAFLDDYPPELEPWNVIGRKAWRKEHLLELIEKEFGPDRRLEVGPDRRQER